MLHERNEDRVCNLVDDTFLMQPTSYTSRPEDHQIEADQYAARDWAREMLRHEDKIVLFDTETTRLDGYVTQLGAVSLGGDVLIDILVDPGEPISSAASEVSGIHNDDVAGKDSFDSFLPELAEIFDGKHLLIYNAPFDLGVLQRELRRIPESLCWNEWRANWTSQCLMRWNAQWSGHWLDEYNEYRWWNLNGPHSATGDCLKMIEVLWTMAEIQPVY